MFSGSEREEVAFENLNCRVRLLALYMWWSPPLSDRPTSQRFPKTRVVSVGSGEKQREGKDGANRLQVAGRSMF